MTFHNSSLIIRNLITHGSFVNTVLIRRVLAAAILLAPLAHAATEPPKKAPEPPPLMMQAFTAAMHELQNAVDDGASLHKIFDKLINFQHSPETAKMLLDSFGNPRPWTLEKGGRQGERTAYRGSLLPLQRTTPAGNVLSWSEFPIDLLVDKSGNALDYRGVWPSISFEDQDARMTMSNLSVSGNQHRGGSQLWFGTMQGGLERIEFSGKTKPFTIAMRDTTFAAQMLERPRTVDLVHSFGIKSIEVEGLRIDDFKMALRIANIEKSALVALREAEKKASAREVATRDDLSAMMPLLKSFVRGAARHKTALMIEEMSVAFHGHKALLRGRVGLDQVREADMADMKRVGKLVDARFEIKVPVALVREVALVMAQQQAAAANKTQAQPQDAATLAQSITDAMVGKVLGNGYARLKDDVLVSTITVRAGVLRINGKKVDLPTPPEKTPPQTPAKAALFMQARRITDSCTLPDYPAEVVAQDGALALTLEFVVDPKGELQDLTLAQASTRPDYDSAVLAAFADCRFIPALSDGKPVKHAMTYTVTREPGSVRP